MTNNYKWDLSKLYTGYDDPIFVKDYDQLVNYKIENVNTNTSFKQLEEIKTIPYTTIFYEAPHRIEDTLQDMLEVLGNRQMCLARELTKVHEEYIRGTIEEVLEVAATCKGEMVIVMDGFKQDDVVFDMYTAITKVDEYIESGMRTKEAIGLVAKEMACKKNELYEAYHKR